jgi:hypothetical protein
MKCCEAIEKTFGQDQTERESTIGAIIFDLEYWIYKLPPHPDHDKIKTMLLWQQVYPCLF